MIKLSVCLPALLILIFCTGRVTAYDAREARVDGDTEIKAMLDAARKQDVPALMQYARVHRKDLKNDRILHFAYYLALYMVDPKANEKAFVEAFPADKVMDIYNRIEEPRYTSATLYSVFELGIIASKGNEEAILKCLIAYSHSDAAVAEGLSYMNWDLLQEHPKKTLEMLAAIPSEQRKEIYTGFGTETDRAGFGELQRKLLWLKNRVSKKARAVIEEIASFNFPFE